jgi:hypothetical protein
VLVLHVELVEVCCCSGWEYEAVCGAVDEADAVQGADGVGYLHRSADFAGQFLGGPGTLVVVDEQQAHDRGLGADLALGGHQGRLRIGHGELRSPCVWASARNITPCRGRSCL